MIRSLLLAVALLAAPVPAFACFRPIAGPAEVMARPWVTVAVVRITGVRSFDPARPEADWEARAEWARLVDGFDQPRAFRLRHREETECPRVLPLPREGELWAIYLGADYHEGDVPVHDAWPLAWAERLDPRFGGAPAP